MIFIADIIIGLRLSNSFPGDVVLEDRREHKRFTRPNTLRVIDSTCKQPMGDLVNLSTNGAMLTSSEPIKPASKFKCMMELQPTITGYNEIHFELECRWSRKNISKGRWESGHRLIATGDNAYILSYLVLGFKLCGWGDPSIPDVETIEMPNRRNAARFEFAEKLPIYELRSYRQLGTLEDLSVTGFRILSERSMSRGDVLKCRVRLPKKVLDVEFVQLTVKCMWCRPSENPKRFESGHEFVDISREETAVLMHLMINYGRPRYGEKKILRVG